jgi:hypothetical protein
LVVAAVVASLGAAVYAVLWDAGAESGVAAAAGAREETSTPGSIGSSAPPHAPADAPHADGELALVPIKVTTDPAGASVQVVGGAEVCASTPCSFEVVAGSPVALMARRGRAQAVTAVTPAGATELHLVLDVAASGKPGASHAVTATSTPGNAAAVKRDTTTAKAARRADEPPGDLKVPEMYRER